MKQVPEKSDNTVPDAAEKTGVAQFLYTVHGCLYFFIG
jgi:hypothetical protein